MQTYSFLPPDSHSAIKQQWLLKVVHVNLKRVQNTLHKNFTQLLAWYAITLS